MRKLFLASFAIFLAYGYLQLVTSFSGSLTIWPTPQALKALFGSRLVAARVWLLAWHTLAVVMAATPIALAACWAYGKQVVPWAAGIAVLALLPGTIESIAPGSELPLAPFIRVTLVIDTLKIVLALPLIAALLSRRNATRWMIGFHAAGALALGLVLIATFGGNAVNAMGTSFVVYLFAAPVAVVATQLWIRRTDHLAANHRDGPG